MRWLATIVVSFAVVASSIPGCTSATQKVSDSARKVIGHADNIDSYADQIDQETLKDPIDPKAIGDLTAAQREETSEIRKEANNVVSQVPKLENKSDGVFEQISTILKLFGWIGLLVALLVVLIMTGALGGIRKFFGLLGAMIPSVKPWSIPPEDREDTKVLKKMDRGEMEPREAIAYFRGKYPGISRAWSLPEKKSKEQEKPSISEETPSSGSTTS